MRRKTHTGDRAIMTARKLLSHLNHDHVGIPKATGFVNAMCIMSTDFMNHKDATLCDFWNGWLTAETDAGEHITVEMTFIKLRGAAMKSKLLAHDMVAFKRLPKKEQTYAELKKHFAEAVTQIFQQADIDRAVLPVRVVGVPKREKPQVNAALGDNSGGGNTAGGGKGKGDNKGKGKGGGKNKTKDRDKGKGWKG